MDAQRRTTAGPDGARAGRPPVPAPREPSSPAGPRAADAVRPLLRAGAHHQLAALLATASFVAGILLRDPVAAAAGCSAALAALLGVRSSRAALRGLRVPPGTAVVPRTLLVCAPALRADVPGPVVVAVALLVAAALAEPAADGLARAAGPYAAHLPGIVVRAHGRIDPGRAASVALLLSAATAWAAVAGASGAWLAAVAAVPLAGAAVVGVDAVLRLGARRRAERALPGAVADYAPRFALHWDAPAGTAYQVLMWLPQLERLGERFIVVLRRPGDFAQIAARTAAPVLVRPEPRSLDAVAAASLRVVFYVNNAARNVHFVRFPGPLHVQLNHGESDKAPSWSPVFRLYDRDFVAGRAAVDRFAANGVRVPGSLFTIVGRPQVRDVLVRRTTSSVPTALYAPTWVGANADSDHSSLIVGERIVRALLDRGLTVLFRPHPYTDRDPRHAAAAARIRRLLVADSARSGRRHVVDATSALTLVGCFNAADLLVADVSSVVPDFLRSEKPFAITAAGRGGADFAAEFPIARAAYVIADDAHDVGSVLDEMTGPDPLRTARADARRYFLGDFPDDEYDDVFVREARRLLRD